MNRPLLGMSPLGWIVLAWVCLAGTWLAVRIYRTLIAPKDSDELFITPPEMRQIRSHLRDVDRWAGIFRAASLAVLVAVVVVWALGGRV